MKLFKTLLYLIGILVSLEVHAQTKSCCSSVVSSAEFAMLGADEKFQSAHLAPEPFIYQAKKGMMISFATDDGGKGNAFSVPALDKTDNYLFVFHEWWGLNDYVRREAERLAEDLPGVNVIAIDLYDGQLATNAEDAGRIMQSVKPERAESIIRGTIAFIRANAVIQTIGWCFGGGWSMQAAMIAGNKSKGCIIYYGMPEKDEEKLKKFNVPVLGIFATQDGWINKEVISGFEQQMKKLNKPLTIHWFEADHAFANPSNPKYNEKAAGEARKLSLDFIKSNFNR